MEIIIIIAINLILYYRTIFFDGVVDDIRLRRKHEKDLDKWTFKNLRIKLYGGAMFPKYWMEHLFTILLHSLICVMIYKAFGSTYVSFLGSLFYAILPNNNQTAIWLNGRRYQINVLLVLAMWALRPYGYILFPLTLLFQVNAIPILILGIKYIYFPLFFLIIFILYFRLTKRKIPILGTLVERCSSRMRESDYIRLHPKKLILAVKSYGYLFFRTLFPFKIAFYTPFFQEYAITKSGTKVAYSFNLEFWKGIVAVLITAITYYYIPEVRFYLIWYVVFISIWLNLITVTQICADRYTVVANIGLMLAVAHILSGYPLLLGLFCGIYIAQNLKIQEMYRDLDNFYLYGIWEEPRAVLNICYYVNAAIELAFYFQAMTATMRGLIYNPKDYKLLITKARLLHRLGYKNDKEATLKQIDEIIDDQIFLSREDLEKGLKELR